MPALPPIRSRVRLAGFHDEKRPVPVPSARDLKEIPGTGGNRAPGASGVLALRYTRATRRGARATGRGRAGVSPVTVDCGCDARDDGALRVPLTNRTGPIPVSMK